MCRKRHQAVLSRTLTIALQEKQPEFFKFALFTSYYRIFPFLFCNRAHINKSPDTVIASIAKVKFHHHFIQHIFVYQISKLKCDAVSFFHFLSIKPTAAFAVRNPYRHIIPVINVLVAPLNMFSTKKAVYNR